MKKLNIYLPVLLCMLMLSISCNAKNPEFTQNDFPISIGADCDDIGAIRCVAIQAAADAFEIELGIHVFEY